MLTRGIKFWLWGLPGRATAMRVWDRLPLIGAERVIPASVPASPGRASPLPITHEAGSLFDADRGIGLEYTLYRPQKLAGSQPIIIYTLPTDWGDKYPAPRGAYIVEHLAAHGYLVIVVEHGESDKLILPEDIDNVENPREAIAIASSQREKSHNRFLDISFVIDMLKTWNGDSGPLAGHIDLARIGVSGYSYGATTALVLLGEKVGLERRSYKDTRIKAGVAYGALAEPPNIPDDEFADLDRPILYVTGSRDRTWAVPTLPEDNARAFHMSPASDQYLLTLRGADHVTHGGKRIEDGVAGRREAYNHSLIQAAGLAFWDAHLKDDDGARQWLDEDFGRQLGRSGKFKRK